MENVYSSERRSAAPKVVMFRTATASLLLVGILATLSEFLSFMYFEIVQLRELLCFMWPGFLGMIVGALGILLVNKLGINAKWCLAKLIVALSIITVLLTLASVTYRILLIQRFPGGDQHASSSSVFFLHFTFSLILELALLALSVLITNIAITMYKLRTIIDGAELSNGVPTPDSISFDARYLNLNEEDV